jgi:8-oxo-dGTP pyrophosphatase MutT (NUDIX family)
LHYEAGHWDFVKGHVEKGEAEADTVRRETVEETGLSDVDFVDGFRERISYYYRRGGRTVFKEVIFYLLQANREEVQISGEHVGYAWLDYPQAMRRLTFKNARNVLRKANVYLERMRLTPRTPHKG